MTTKPMCCLKCERPRKLCECLDLDAIQVQVLFEERRRRGTEYIYPTVEVSYGRDKYAVTRFAEGQGELARAFVRFLESDAIFDCRIPDAFRKQI